MTALTSSAPYAARHTVDYPERREYLEQWEPLPFPNVDERDTVDPGVT